MSDSAYAISYEDVPAARERIHGYIHRTPVMTCGALDEMAKRSLFFKCENFQKVGAFKFRGACNAVFKLSDEEAARGVVTHSSGNHAQALALAAKIRKIPAHIVMPVNAPSVKKNAVIGYGATIYDCEPTQQSREETAEKIQKQTGAVFIHPNNDPNVIAGQGTSALELLEEVKELDAIVAPIGGGGLMSGVCIAAARSNSHILLIGAEPTGADDAARSLAAGERLPQTDPNTIADGLLTGLGSNNWPILRDHLETIITVSDDEIIKAMRIVWERMKIIIEPSSATAVAVILSDQFKSITGNPEDQRVGVILTGGNVDLDSLPWM